MGNISEINGHLVKDSFAREQINGKLSKPQTAGKVGQVLSVDSEGEPAWIDPPSGGGSEGSSDKKWKYIGTVDFSSGGSDFVLSEPATEVLFVAVDLVNGSATNSTVSAMMNDVNVGGHIPSGKSGTPLSSWVYYRLFSGINLLMTIRSGTGAISSANVQLNATVQTTYNLLNFSGEQFNKIGVKNMGAVQYNATGGTVKIYAR